MFLSHLLTKGGFSQDAVDMYTKVNMWEAAHTIAVTYVSKVVGNRKCLTIRFRYMGKAEITLLYVNQAQKFEAQGRLKEAEKLYLTVNEPDLAINMYKKHKLYDHMIRLVASFHKDYLQQTHLHLAQQLETEVLSSSLLLCIHFLICYRDHLNKQKSITLRQVNGRQQ